MKLKRAVGEVEFAGACIALRILSSSTQSDLQGAVGEIGGIDGVSRDIITKRVWSTDGLTPTEKLVALAIATAVGDDNSVAEFAVPDIARLTGLSDRSVQRAMRTLEEASVIERVHTGGLGPGDVLRVRFIVETRS